MSRFDENSPSQFLVLMKLDPPNVGLCLNGVPEICAIYPLLDRQRPLGPVDPSF